MVGVVGYKVVIGLIIRLTIIKSVTKITFPASCINKLHKRVNVGPAGPTANYGVGLNDR